MENVTIITVNFNGFEITCSLIDSLLNHSFKGQIVVVDNGSNVNEAQLLSDKYPTITVIRSEINLGFAGGNNLGIEAAIHPYLFFINNDTIVTDNCWEPLVARIKANSKIGMACPKIYFEYAPEVIQFAGYTSMQPITLRNNMVGYMQEEEGQFNTPFSIPYAMGAAMMTTKEVINRAGSMPELYFLYYEELDWSERIKAANYEIWFEPKAKIFHKESMATGKVSPLKQYYMTRNRLLFAKRNLNRGWQILSIMYLLFVAVPKSCIINLRQGRKDLFNAIIKGAFHGLIGRSGRL